VSSDVPVTLRPVRDDDLPFLYDLYARSRYDFQYVDWPSDEQRQQVTRMQFNAQYQHYHEHYPQSEHNVIIRTDVPSQPRVGRIWTAYEDDHILVLDLNILPEHQSQGIGTHLINGKKDEATADGCPLRHHVEVDNEDALRLYRRLDFEIVEDMQSHYLMEWRPSVSPH